jgi:hypothetical protein
MVNCLYYRQEPTKDTCVKFQETSLFGGKAYVGTPSTAVEELRNMKFGTAYYHLLEAKNSLIY